MVTRLSAVSFVLAFQGCVWIEEEGSRLDLDSDGYLVSVDCNDEQRDVTALEPWSGDLACGAIVDADAMVADDHLRVVNCVHPLQPDDLVVLGWREDVYRFSSEAGTDVVVSLETDGFLLEVGETDTSGVAMFANRGSVCELSTCDVALPLAPAAYRSEVPVSDRPVWRPELRFHAAPGEGWFVVVSGGRSTGDPRPSPYQLHVACTP